MVTFIDSVVQWVVRVLMGLLAVVVVAGTIDLAVLLARDLLAPPIGVLEVREMLEILGLFLMILIAIEMIYVVRLYVTHRHLDVHAVLMVALIAVARKVIVLDLEKYDAAYMAGIAGLVLALSAALYIAHRLRGPAEAGPAEAGPGGPPGA
ncbi:MAG: hypothetical protein FJ221_01185 [Lentisphaerae bacterium]|nr:hypothetical protein [Lentisphaerota bacterium]